MKETDNLWDLALWDLAPDLQYYCFKCGQLSDEEGCCQCQESIGPVTEDFPSHKNNNHYP